MPPPPKKKKKKKKTDGKGLREKNPIEILLRLFKVQWETKYSICTNNFQTFGIVTVI